MYAREARCHIIACWSRSPRSPATQCTAVDSPIPANYPYMVAKPQTVFSLSTLAAVTTTEGDDLHQCWNGKANIVGSGYLELDGGSLDMDSASEMLEQLRGREPMRRSKMGRLCTNKSYSPLYSQTLDPQPPQHGKPVTH